MQTNWQSSHLVYITPRWYNLSMVGVIPKLKTRKWQHFQISNSGWGKWVFFVFLSPVGRMERLTDLSPRCKARPGSPEAPPSISTWPLIITDHESSSSPSFMTTVPAFSTTANTITRQSSPSSPTESYWRMPWGVGEFEQDFDIVIRPIGWIFF